MNRIKGKLKKILNLRSMKELDLLKDWQRTKILLSSIRNRNLQDDSQKSYPL
jgi:hypothetical protein